ncbi:uncharacterized protein [Ptychodera flava]|uniref:uncharacterized protein n=1 Tax=Ptychodera flava TaxID=63121 RepID=UPI00396A55F1
MCKPGSYLAKVDLKSAYRSVPISIDSQRAMGLRYKLMQHKTWTYMVDTRLPFGAAKSPEIFTRITQSITRMMRRKGYDVVIVYLDDFLIIADSKLACEQAFNALQQLLQQLGFSINWDKVVEPTQCLTFLGIEINAQTRTLSLDDTKLQEVSDLLEYWLPKRRATKRELQQLIGKLNWAARVIRGGRTFLRRLIDVTNSVSRQSHHIRLNRQARADISWWANLSKSFNGTAFFIEETPLPQQIFTTDACSAAGAGIYANDWFYTRWSADHPTTADAHINLKELYTVLLACRRWHRFWDKRHIVVYTDNTTTMYIINSGTSRNATAMEWLRELFWLSAISNFQITARYVRTNDNDADSVSRLHEIKHYFRALDTLQSREAHPLQEWHYHMSVSTHSLLLQDLCSKNFTN